MIRVQNWKKTQKFQKKIAKTEKETLFWPSWLVSHQLRTKNGNKPCKDPECIHLQRKGVRVHQKLLENVQGVFLRQVFRVRFVCLNAGSGRITCSGYPGRRPPSPPPSSCSFPWPPAGRLKHTKHAKLNSNLNNGKSFWQKYKQRKKQILDLSAKWGHKHDIYLKVTSGCHLPCSLFNKFFC